MLQENCLRQVTVTLARFMLLLRRFALIFLE